MASGLTWCMVLRMKIVVIKKVFFDTDCLSSFFWAYQECLLNKMFSKRMVIPEEVYVELLNPCVSFLNKKTMQCVEKMEIEVMEMVYGTEEFDLYNSLIHPPGKKKRIGKGEAAAISLAKVYGGVLASNNIKDITKYIEEFGLEHLTTADILYQALELSYISEGEGNQIWSKMLSKRRRLPCRSFSEYVEQCQIASK